MAEETPGLPTGAWVAALVVQARAAAGDAPVPAYGSAAFEALPADSPLRVVAAIAAAEAYRADTRLADAIGWAAGSPGRVEALAASAGAAIKRTAVKPPPAELAPPRPLVQDPAWPPVIAPPGAVVVPAGGGVVEADQARLIRQLGTERTRGPRGERATVRPRTVAGVVTPAEQLAR